jgi:hypothetical protein
MFDLILKKVHLLLAPQMMILRMSALLDRFRSSGTIEMITFTPDAQILMTLLAEPVRVS